MTRQPHPLAAMRRSSGLAHAPWWTGQALPSTDLYQLHQDQLQQWLGGKKHIDMAFLSVVQHFIETKVSAEVWQPVQQRLWQNQSSGSRYLLAERLLSEHRLAGWLQTAAVRAGLVSASMPLAARLVGKTHWIKKDSKYHTLCGKSVAVAQTHEHRKALTGVDCKKCTNRADANSRFLFNVAYWTINSQAVQQKEERIYQEFLEVEKIALAKLYNDKAPSNETAQQWVVENALMPAQCLFEQLHMTNRPVSQSINFPGAARNIHCDVLTHQHALDLAKFLR